VVSVEKEIASLRLSARDHDIEEVLLCRRGEDAAGIRAFRDGSLQRMETVVVEENLYWH
jgi:hypothetical protein